MTIFSFRGVANRKTFILWTLALFGAVYLAGALLCIGCASLDTPLPPEDIPPMLVGVRVSAAFAWPIVILGLLVLAVSLIGTLALGVRRLHDAGLSGLLILLVLVVDRVVPDLPSWPQFLPPLSALVSTAIMAALPQGRGKAVEGNSIASTF